MFLKTSLKSIQFSNIINKEELKEMSFEVISILCNEIKYFTSSIFPDSQAQCKIVSKILFK